MPDQPCSDPRVSWYGVHWRFRCDCGTDNLYGDADDAHRERRKHQRRIDAGHAVAYDGGPR